jgi:tetratricopeptide (TPR) repeat protein
VHTYKIDLAANQFLEAIVEQRGINVAVGVIAPNGTMILDGDRDTEIPGSINVSVITDAAGRCLLRVKARASTTPSGSYSLRLVEMSAATNKDYEAVEAIKLTGEVESLIAASQYDHALPLAERVLRLREEALKPDDPDIVHALNNLAFLNYSRGDFATAEPQYARAITIYEQNLGPEHPGCGGVEWPRRVVSNDG